MTRLQPPRAPQFGNKGRQYDRHQQEHGNVSQQVGAFRRVTESPAGLDGSVVADDLLRDGIARGLRGFP